MVMALGRCVGSGQARMLQELLEACGRCEEVPEAYVDIHTGLSGSGVAFVSVPPPGALRAAAQSQAVGGRRPGAVPGPAALSQRC